MPKEKTEWNKVLLRFEDEEFEKIKAKAKKKGLRPLHYCKSVVIESLN